MIENGARSSLPMTFVMAHRQKKKRRPCEGAAPVVQHIVEVECLKKLLLRSVLFGDSNADHPTFSAS